MRIKSYEVKITWEDGEGNDISRYLPPHVCETLETFLDYWEERYGNDEKTEDQF